ncbi:hypothetical protein EYV94_28815, partial [Puteibacter caeruleilacunae]
MRQRVFTLLIAVFIATNIAAQIPAHIKPQLDQLVTAADKHIQRDKSAVRNRILSFIKKAPSKESKQAALEYIKSKSTSNDVKI